MTEEMKILKAFVEEFSPIHKGQVDDFSYNELFEVIEDIVDVHYKRG